ncbi:1,4-alpha-glucan branching protein GlgB [Modestobacter sp. I12A-02628]|uniref:1,4-alpha-glucan branching enzyme GlgB n=1 Tax=Goekera deserti TaxID=2497753 RepID=A0A7K3WH37_9ACTN|nr:1,4-alpha-glucan branching protein GlgB [Goekera deserti]MPQ97362.1 1,4-alpha-glucan branching protein GlgB [Goekera deserti]NDI50125.1 1,4-alpha-glucan branching protein GlgB [Goekera deserti]NEL55692.1 1,4-alpha-glucan branching protein GlgB [Goekera deserti]
MSTDDAGTTSTSEQPGAGEVAAAAVEQVTKAARKTVRKAAKKAAEATATATAATAGAVESLGESAPAPVRKRAPKKAAAAADGAAPKAPRKRAAKKAAPTAPAGAAPAPADTAPAAADVAPDAPLGGDPAGTWATEESSSGFAPSVDAPAAEAADVAAESAPQDAAPSTEIVAVGDVADVEGGPVAADVVTATSDAPSDATSDAPVEVPAVPAGPQEATQEQMQAIVDGWSHDPHATLGAHEVPGGWAVRTLRPDAVSVVVVDQDGSRYDAQQLHPGGVFEARLPAQPGDYRIDVTYPDGAGGTDTFLVDDPYRWLPTLGEIDQHLIREGRHERLWEALGAHLRGYDTPGGRVEGASFAVWAPNAQGVKVTGDFDMWQARMLPMRSLGSSGVWEIYVPGVQDGQRYRFHVLGRDGVWREKSDPMAFATEVPPLNASVVTRSTHEWGDDAWLEQRARGNWHERPVSVYEVHAGSWREGLSYREMADELVAYAADAGFTHLEFMPLAEHPFGGSWGYQVTSYYAPTARFGSPDDLRYFIDTAHQAGLGVIVDWVPAHFPKDAWALARFDGTALYEHGDPRRGEQPDWGTLVFDFGRSEVRNFLVANALFWAKEFHIDGIRVDAVASMLYLDYSRNDGEWSPNVHGGRENLEAVAFLQEMNATLYREVPGIMTIAEESTAWPGVTRATHLGGLGFGFKWNMGWMHDSLGYVEKQPVHRVYHHNQLTFSLVYAYSENYVLPISHDEVVYGKGSLLRKMPGDRWQQLANLRAYLAYMWAHPGKQLLFMGQEFAQDGEWAESRSLDWWHLDDPAHRGVLDLVRDLNGRYTESEALWSQDVDPAGFAWIDANDAGGNTLSFLRYGAGGQALACVANFAGTPHQEYRVGLPRGGRWREVLNTDAEAYGGSGVGNLGGVDAVEEPWHGQPFSATIAAPPLGTVWFLHEG